MPIEPATRTQAERRERTRRRLVDATIRSICEVGYRATTTRGVAERAGVSLGALAHHFPTRQALITAALQDAVERGSRNLEPGASRGTPELLDLLWDHFQSDLFVVWIKVWLAAAEDAELYQGLAPIETQLNAGIAAVVAAFAPPDLESAAWKARVTVAINAIRGLVLALMLEPRETRPKRDPWLVARPELIALIDRRP